MRSFYIFTKEKYRFIATVLIFILFLSSLTVNAQFIQLGGSSLNDVYVDEIIIAFDPAATFGVDPFETPKIWNNEPEMPEFYSTIGGNPDPYQYNGMPIVDDTTVYVSLGFIVHITGNYHIRTILETGFPAGTTVTLIDSVMGIHTDMLAPGADYSFYMVQNDCAGCQAQWTGRFYLKFHFPSTNPIQILAPTPAPFCAGEAVQIPYFNDVTLGTFNPGNVFTAQLSDVSGSFASPVDIGSVTSNVTGTINAIIPISTAPGTAYRFRVIASDPPAVSKNNGNDISIGVIPSVVFSGSLPDQCANSLSIDLLDYATVSPAGGHFHGAGTINNYFHAGQVSPSAVPYTLSYIYTDFAGCSDTAYNNIIVNALPIVSFTGTLQDQCANHTTYNLVDDAIVSPAGGHFGGPGVNGTNFNASATSGMMNPIVVFYIYTDGNGCTDSANNEITVHELPVPVITNVNNFYCVYNNDVPMTGNPSGGTFTGNGVSGNIFSPATAGTGIHTIYYEYTDGNGCTETSSFDIEVDECVGIEESNFIDGISISPNPAHNVLNIMCKAKEEYNVIIYNVSGTKVLELPYRNVDKLQIDVTSFSAGLYYVTLQSVNIVKTIKLIVE